jgi:hypothetical protein
LKVFGVKVVCWQMHSCCDFFKPLQLFNLLHGGWWQVLGTFWVLILPSSAPVRLIVLVIATGTVLETKKSAIWWIRFYYLNSSHQNI